MLQTLPMPPLEMRALVGPTNVEVFDNPTGRPIYEEFGLPESAYDAVFDFGCGCGRLARKLLQQTPKPKRYVGIDVHPRMIEWATQNYTSIDPNFTFEHHDVYSFSYATGNRLQLADRFPVDDGNFSLVIAHSLFTHLLRRQSLFYLKEIARILRPDGVAFTSWFFFDRASFPFLTNGPYSLLASETDPTQAVLIDRGWFLDAVREAGLVVTQTEPPKIAGHQWSVFLSVRTYDSIDQFPQGDDSAEWLCGATTKPMAQSKLSDAELSRNQVGAVDAQAGTSWPTPPELFGVLTELEQARKEAANARREMSEIKLSLAWKLTAPLRWLKRRIG